MSEIDGLILTSTIILDGEVGSTWSTLHLPEWFGYTICTSTSPDTWLTSLRFYPHGFTFDQQDMASTYGMVPDGDKKWLK